MQRQVKEKNKLQYRLDELLSETDLRAIDCRRFEGKYLLYMSLVLVPVLIFFAISLVVESQIAFYVIISATLVLYVGSFVLFYALRRRSGTRYVKAHKKVVG